MSGDVFPAALLASELTPEVCQRAVRARDPRFDGVFFVAITSTGVYCRPVCPARVTHPERRRFFPSAAAAEHAGFRPCLRCRPELAPGRALCDAVSRLARGGAQRIAGGALNGRSVAALARELCVSERHLRRALERELGASPVALAQTHRLLLAKRLLADAKLSITRIAFASGFQSLRRFNSLFRERYHMPPIALRRSRHSPALMTNGDASDLVHPTLAYRPPIAWDALLGLLRDQAIPGVELIQGSRYARTIRLAGSTGVIFAQLETRRNGRNGQRTARTRQADVSVALSDSLLPTLMPLLAKLRQLFDHDAEPSVIGAHPEQSGLRVCLERQPGLRMPGALDGFEVALRVLLGGRVNGGKSSRALARRVTESFGEPVGTGFSGLTHLAPSAERIADVGGERLVALGVPRRRADAIVAVARLVCRNELHLEPGSDPITPAARCGVSPGSANRSRQ